MTAMTKTEISHEAVRDAVIAAGSGSTEHFGYPELENGLYLQQNPDEFAALVVFLCENLPPPALSIDIGVASGGQTKLLRDYFPCARTIVVDIGQHPQFPHWQRIKQLVDTEFVLEIIDDSHVRRVRKALRPYKGQIDFAFIDGDHSYEGLKKDIDLVRSLAKPGCVFVLHDTYCVKDCQRVFQELKQDPAFELLFNTEVQFGISVWRMNDAGREVPLWTRLTGG